LITDDSIFADSSADIFIGHEVQRGGGIPDYEVRNLFRYGGSIKTFQEAIDASIKQARTPEPPFSSQALKDVKVG